MKYSANEIGKRIREERKRMNLTQEALGKKIGICGKQISEYESGKNEKIPPLDSMLELCNVFNCELGYLLCEENYELKTQTDTYIHKSLGLSYDAMKSIRTITNPGNLSISKKQVTFSTEIPSLAFKHKTAQCTNVLNSFLETPEFLNLIAKLQELDEYRKDYRSIFEQIGKKLGNEMFDYALDLFLNDRYNTSEPDIKPLDDRVKNALLEISNGFDYRRELEDRIKITRFELFEIHNKLVDRLFPQ